ncbi:uncharacterized protein A4U43_C09F390 [Asparagus officinalis]|uniref:Trichome birefringence-like N-terminal domain-containing protein n=2 Tax=Asparagus officinalis TaxID=4686 RepID=A0A5P1E7I1_ASPOF|nr:uncharacterized protein A4U43_C09F390 [Asparagus officinalis]
MNVNQIHRLHSLICITTLWLCMEPAFASLDSELIGWTDAKEDGVDLVQTHRALPRNCDLSIGEWVYDASYPLYDASCPYLSTEYSCRRNGRPDSDYEKWRWKPHHCLIPR